jgi:hypothetical protein|tara:strand:- start:625 stop:825 length:201 start_codon:yes stop_codon:yes gene_type:complete
MDIETKNILLSKTFWVNVLTIGVVVLNRNTKVIDPLLVEPLAVIILPFVNIGLRAITNKTVSLKGK